MLAYAVEDSGEINVCASYDTRLSLCFKLPSDAFAQGNKSHSTACCHSGPLVLRPLPSLSELSSSLP